MHSVCIFREPVAWSHATRRLNPSIRGGFHGVRAELARLETLVSSLSGEASARHGTYFTA